MKKNEQQQQESKSSANQVPSKLTCPFVEHGVHIIKDAVLIPCCGHFICCDECIREKISGEEIVDCPMKDCGHEIDSLESITSHHQMRSMVNEYLNDVKLNKFNNNNKKKNDDLFIDLYLNDDFDTINPNSLSNENPANDTIKIEIFETEMINKKENLNNYETFKMKEEIEHNSSGSYREKQLGFELVQSSNYHQTNYYPPYQQSSQYPPNPPVYHQQPHIHAYNAGMSNNYGPPFMSNTNMPVGSMPQKQLSEKEFYEMKERILKRE